MNTNAIKVISITPDSPSNKEYIESELYKIFSKYF